MKVRPILLLFASLITGLPSVYAQPDFDVFVSSRATNAVKVYNMDGLELGDFVSPGDGGLSLTEDILFHPDGTVLVTGFNNTAIKQYDGTTGDYLGDFSNGYDLENPSKMSIGPDSLIYVTQWGVVKNKVVRFDLSGDFVDEFTSVPAPNGLGHVWDAHNNFYIALFGSTSDGTVHKFDSDGNDLGTFINSSVLNGPTGIWFDKNGDMLVEDWLQGIVLRYDSLGNFVNNFLTGMTNPEGIAFTPDGEMLIGDWGEDAIHMFDSMGNSLGYFASGGDLTDPNSVKIRLHEPVSAVPNNHMLSEFEVYPTVSDQQFNIRFSLSASSHVDIWVTDAQGSMRQTLLKEKLLPGQHSIAWNPPGSLGAGLYYIILNNGGKPVSVRIFKTE